MMRQTWVIITMVLLSGCSEMFSNEETDDYMEKGIAHIAEKQYAEAMIYFERAMKEEEDEEAETYFHQSSDMDEVMQLYNEGKYKETLGKIDAILNKKEGSPTIEADARDIAAEIETRLKHQKEIEKALETSVSHLEEGDTSAASEELGKAEKLADNYPQLSSYISEITQLEKDIKQEEDKREHQEKETDGASEDPILENQKAEPEEKKSVASAEDSKQKEKEPEREAEEKREEEKTSPAPSSDSVDKEKKEEESPESEPEPESKPEPKAEPEPEPESKPEPKTEPEPKKKESYVSYRNSRYGFSFEYPGYLKKQGAPTNGDGVTMRGEGASLTAYGAHEVNGLSLQGLYQQDIDSLGTVAYKQLGDTSYTISYHQGNNIVYKKLIMTSGVYNTFEFTYPASRQEEFAPAVQRIAATFTAG